MSSSGNLLSPFPSASPAGAGLHLAPVSPGPTRGTLVGAAAGPPAGPTLPLSRRLRGHSSLLVYPASFSLETGFCGAVWTSLHYRSRLCSGSFSRVLPHKASTHGVLLPIHPQAPSWMLPPKTHSKAPAPLATPSLRCGGGGWASSCRRPSGPESGFSSPMTLLIPPRQEPAQEGSAGEWHRLRFRHRALGRWQWGCAAVGRRARGAAGAVGTAWSRRHGLGPSRRGSEEILLWP